MTERTTNSAIAIVPCNDLDAAERWWGKLGFARPRPEDPETFADYRILSDGQGAEVHLQAAVPGWVVPGRNPFGIYLSTPRVDELAALAREAIIEPGKTPADKPWGMYEFALAGPDGLLVRVGWPSRLRRKA